MKYYSEDTVRKIIRSVAHTALEQMDNFVDAVLAYQPNIELPDRHGRLIDADEHMRVLEQMPKDAVDDVQRVSFAMAHMLICQAPTVLEASECSNDSC